MASKHGAANLRIVLVGKTGAGKSASGNTILRREAFDSQFCARSVTTECKKQRGVFEGQTLAVIDTPGLFDTSEEDREKEIAKCVTYASPGPHAFLIVIRLNTFTEEEKEAVKIIQNAFGEASADFAMALFTRGDDLETHNTDIDTFIKSNKDLRNFVRECKGGYHVFNNRDEDPSQVRELLKKINNMVEKNGGKYYSNKMFKEVEKKLLKMMEEILKKNSRMTEEEARKQAEEGFDGFESFAWGALSSAFAAGGAVSGSLFGPLGTAGGAAVGAAAGISLAALTKRRCSIQ